MGSQVILQNEHDDNDNASEIEYDEVYNANLHSGIELFSDSDRESVLDNNYDSDPGSPGN